MLFEIIDREETLARMLIWMNKNFIQNLCVSRYINNIYLRWTLVSKQEHINFLVSNWWIDNLDASNDEVEVLYIYGNISWWVKKYVVSELIHKPLETHGCLICTVATAALVLKHQAISIHSTVYLLCWASFVQKTQHSMRTKLESEIKLKKKKKYPVV